MNQVDVYINNERLDLFQDEQITINVSVQNIKDLATIFTDFTQSFTVPASTTNNKIFSHYYRFDVTGGVDGRVRQSARIEINSLTFREGVIELESVSNKNNEPSAYTMTFYGQLVNLKDLFGDDYLYDLDLSAYDHDYDGATILSGFNQDALGGGDIFYPLMSPKNNWFYDSGASSHSPANIAYHATHNHGVSYAHLKPAVKVVKLFEAIETKYGIDFTGNFMSDTQFNKLFLWAHRIHVSLQAQKASPHSASSSQPRVGEVHQAKGGAKATSNASDGRAEQRKAAAALPVPAHYKAQGRSSATGSLGGGVASVHRWLERGTGSAARAAAGSAHTKRAGPAGLVAGR